MFIRYGNAIVNLDNTFCFVVDDIDDAEDSLVVVAHSTDGLRCELAMGTQEGVTRIMDRIFESIKTGESSEVD